jgi:RAD51-like protein 2
VHSSQQILSVGPRLPATQSAAALLDSPNDVFTCSPPIDDLLGGGLRRGHLLELLGPPGTPKTALVLEVIRGFIENREDVLIIGIYPTLPCLYPPGAYQRVLDPQNTISPGIIDEKLRCETTVYSLSRVGAHCDTAISTASSSVPQDYSRHVHLMAISQVTELMSFLYTLPSYLQENPKVLGNALIILARVLFG